MTEPRPFEQWEIDAIRALPVASEQRWLATLRERDAQLDRYRAACVKADEQGMEW